MTFSGPPRRSSNFLRVSRWQPKILAASERDINLRSAVIALGLLGPRVVDLRLVLMAYIQAHSYRTPVVKTEFTIADELGSQPRSFVDSGST